MRKEDIEEAVSSLITGLLEATDEQRREMLERELESLLAGFDLGPLSEQFRSTYRRMGRELQVLKRPYLEQLHHSASQLSEGCLGESGETVDDTLPAGGRKRILVVDDDPDFLHLVPLLLEAMGHQCDVRDSADAALHFLESHPVDALIVDIAMPRVSGPELVRLGLEAGTLPPKTIFASALPYGKIKLVAEESGIGFLQKPCTKDKLLQLVG